MQKKYLRLAYSQGNNTAYSPNIKSIARYLSTQYSNNKPVHQRGDKKGDKRKGDDLKSKDKDSNTGDTAGVHVEDTTSTEESTAPSRGASIGTHVLEKIQESSCPSRTIDEILEAHPMDCDEFWGNTNHTDVSIDTANSEKTIGGKLYYRVTHTLKQRTSYNRVIQQGINRTRSGTLT